MGGRQGGGRKNADRVRCSTMMGVHDGSPMKQSYSHGASRCYCLAEQLQGSERCQRITQKGMMQGAATRGGHTKVPHGCLLAMCKVVRGDSHSFTHVSASVTSGGGDD